MKKLGVLAMALVLIAATAVVVLVLLRGRSAERELQAAAEPTGEAAVAAARSRIDRRLRGDARSAGPIRLSESDLADLLLASLADHPRGRRLLAVSKRVEAGIRGERVELGVVVNLSQIRSDDLEESEREVVDKIRRFLPFLEDRDLDIAISGVPSARAGEVVFARDARVRLSLVELELDTVAERLGGGSEKVREGLALPVPRYEILDIRVENGEVVLTARPG